MNLFLNTLSSPAKIIIFDDARRIIDTESWEIKGNESSTLIPHLDALLKQNNLEYAALKNFVVVNGPGSFTGVRTVVLAINTINYITHKHITPLSYFDLFQDYPIVKASSKRDCFVQFSQNNPVEIIANTALWELLKEKNIKEIYWEVDEKALANVKILEKIDYNRIIKEVEFEKNTQIQAMYIKKPNIS